MVFGLSNGWAVASRASQGPGAVGFVEVGEAKEQAGSMSQPDDDVV